MSPAEAGNPSPRVTGALAKLRRNKEGLSNASANSLPLTAGSSVDSDSAAPDASEHAGADGTLRASLETAIDKVKERTRRRSVDDRHGSRDDGGRLSTLLSRTKRKSKKTDRSRDSARNHSADREQPPGSRSDSEQALDESRRSSLLTDDEKSDANGHPLRPSLSPHQSHQGYLTISSPDINAQTSSVPAPLYHTISSEHAPAADLRHNIPRDVPHILEPSTSADSLSTPGPSERSPSPSTNSHKSLALSRNKSGGGDSAKSISGSGGGGLSGLFKSSNRSNSTASRTPSDIQPTGQVPVLSTDAPSEEALTTATEPKVRPETPKFRGRNLVDTAILSTPPNLLDTPTTLVTPPTPTISNSDSATFPSHHQTSPRKDPPHSLSSVRPRRSQSVNLPSKLSTAIPAPLTPTEEETKTPGGTLSQPTVTGGFFSGFFSAAQKASVQFSNSINSSVSSNQKSRPSTAAESNDGEEVIPGIQNLGPTGPQGDDKKTLAIETLGQGSLSLSHLGISDTQDFGRMSSSADQQGAEASAQNTDRNKKAEEEAAARAVSSAYEKPPPAAVGHALSERPLSIASNERLTLGGDQTPPRNATETESGIVKRNGSVRSKLSGRQRKHRSSSATAGTSNSLAAVVKDSTLGPVNPAAHGAGHRLTGFAVASSKRNKDFHQLFRSVPEDDYLIEDYSAALQRDILLHGRLYVSEGHICFSSNILGWVTNLVISFDEVVSVEKKSTAVIFPNALVISTLHARNTFASFVARDSTYELLIGIWKMGHPNLKSSLNGVALDDAGTGDKTEVAEADNSEAETEEGTEDEVYDEDADDDTGSFTDAGFAASTAGSEVGDATLSRKPSANLVSSGPPASGQTSKGLETADAVVTGAAVSSDFPGTSSHEPTQCADAAEHYDKPLNDITIPAPLGKVYSMMFGPASGAFMRKWLVEDQKSQNLNYVDDKTGLDSDHTNFVFDYIKPLSGPVGPKQTKCITTNTLKAFDLEKAVTVDCSTQTPDVPGGNIFTVKTRYCLMWGPQNSTRLIATCTIEWSGKSWLRGPIDKAAEQGQIDYVNRIVASLKAAVTTKPPVKGMQRKGKRKGKKEVFDAEEANIQRDAAIAAEQKAPSWGVLEPVHQMLAPIIALVRPFITSEVIIAVLFVLLAYKSFFPSRAGSGVAFPNYSSPERIAAYEEIWRREESALWDWLEDRTGIDNLYAPISPLPRGDHKRARRQQTLRAQDMGKRLESEKMSGRQIDEQIRTTEERLAALKEAVGRKRAKRRQAAEAAAAAASTS